MRFGTVGIVAVLLLIVPGVVRGDSAEVPRRPLVSRTYNQYEISRENLRVAWDSGTRVTPPGRAGRPVSGMQVVL